MHMKLREALRRAQAGRGSRRSRPSRAPASRTRSSPRASITPRRSVARLLLLVASGGASVHPWPRRSGADHAVATRPACGIRWRHAHQFCGQPCWSTSGSPWPASATWILQPAHVHLAMGHAFVRGGAAVAIRRARTYLSSRALHDQRRRHGALAQHCRRAPASWPSSGHDRGRHVPGSSPPSSIRSTPARIARGPRRRRGAASAPPRRVRARLEHRPAHRGQRRERACERRHPQAEPLGLGPAREREPARRVRQHQRERAGQQPLHGGRACARRARAAPPAPARGWKNITAAGCAGGRP